MNLIIALLIKMAQVIFNYKGNEISIQCDLKDKFKDIFNKFSNKININSNRLIFLYGGKKLEENVSFESQAFSGEKINNQINVLVYDMSDFENNIDVNKLKKELNIILSTYLDDRRYLENKIDNWKEVIFKEIEQIFLNYKNYKTFIHLTIYDKSIIGNNCHIGYGCFNNIDIFFSLELDFKSIKTILNIIMFKKNIKRTKTDIPKVIISAEKEFLNLAEGREYKIFIEKYYKIFEDKFEKEILKGHKFSLFYIIEISNKYYKSSKGFRIINGDNNDYFLNKFIDAGDIRSYIAFGKANSS